MGKEEERNNKIIYKPAIDFVYFKDTSTENNLKHPFAGVIITYDLFTIYVTEAEFDKNKNEISASGKIVVEDGSTRYTAKKLLIKIKNQTAEIQISK